MSCLSASPMAGCCFVEVRKASHFGSPALLLFCRTSCSFYHQTTSVLNQKGRASCFAAEQCYIDSRATVIVGTWYAQSQRLQYRIKQHVSKSMWTGQYAQDRTACNRSCKLTNYEPSCDSTIGHLLTNQSCALHYSDDRFSILSTGRSAFHLFALEATFIKVSRQGRI